MSTTTTTVARSEPPISRGRRVGSVPDRVMAALVNEPNPVRPSEIAGKTRLSTTQVANALRVLTLRGDVKRIRDAIIVNGPGASRYVAVVRSEVG